MYLCLSKLTSKCELSYFFTYTAQRMSESSFFHSFIAVSFPFSFVSIVMDFFIYSLNMFFFFNKKTGYVLLGFFSWLPFLYTF